MKPTGPSFLVCRRSTQPLAVGRCNPRTPTLRRYPFAIVNLPGYIGSVSPTGTLNNEASGFGYSNIEPYANNTSVVVESGLAFNSSPVTAGQEYSLLSITFSSTAVLPSTVRIGVLLNNEPPASAANNNDQMPLSVRLQGPGGVLDTASETVNHPTTENVDLYFFNVTPSAGSTFTLYGTADTNMFSHIVAGGLTFSSPEPASIGLLGIGAIGVLKRRRR